MDELFESGGTEPWTPPTEPRDWYQLDPNHMNRSQRYRGWEVLQHGGGDVIFDDHHLYGVYAIREPKRRWSSRGLKHVDA